MIDLFDEDFYFDRELFLEIFTVLEKDIFWLDVSVHNEVIMGVFND